MAFWQENYQFIKEVYDMRHHKMAEWMENVEKAISRIMADKVYTSAEFKRERDTFNVSSRKYLTSKSLNYSIILVSLQRPGAHRSEEMACSDSGDLDGRAR